MVRFAQRLSDSGSVWFSVVAVSVSALACGGTSVGANEPNGDLDVPAKTDTQPASTAAATRLEAKTPKPSRQSDRPVSYSAGQPRGQRLSEGRRIDLNVRDADLHNLFRLLADVGGVNIVVGQGVSGKVTLALRQVNWRVALNVICQAHQLAISESGSILLIQKRPTH